MQKGVYPDPGVVDVPGGCMASLSLIMIYCIFVIWKNHSLFHLFLFHLEIFCNRFHDLFDGGFLADILVIRLIIIMWIRMSCVM